MGMKAIEIIILGILICAGIYFTMFGQYETRMEGEDGGISGKMDYADDGIDEETGDFEFEGSDSIAEPILDTEDSENEGLGDEDLTGNGGLGDEESKSHESVGDEPIGDEMDGNEESESDKSVDDEPTLIVDEMAGMPETDVIDEKPEGIDEQTDNENGVSITYVGCYKDGEPPRFEERMQNVDVANNPIAECAQYCRERGHNYMGLQYDNKCFCGNDLAKITRLGERDQAEGQCGMKQQGTNEYDAFGCRGGRWTNCVYDLQDEQPDGIQEQNADFEENTEGIYVR